MAMMTEKILTYPVLCVCKENLLHFAREADELLICSTKAFKSNFYKDLYIINILCNEYLVLTADKEGTVGPFWGYNLLRGQRIRVSITMSKLPMQPIDALKAKLIQLVESSEFYDDNSIAKKIIRDSTDCSNLISSLAEEYYKEY